VLKSFLVLMILAQVSEIDQAQDTDKNATWRNTELVDYLTTFGPDRTVIEDPFIAITPPLPPENIVLTFPIPARTGLRTTYWTYDREAQTMTIVASENEGVAAGRARAAETPPSVFLTMRGWSLSTRRSPARMELVGGRQIPVRIMHVSGFGQVQTNPVPGRRPDVRVFRHTFSIEPEAARALSGELELRVLGKAQPWRQDRNTLCVNDSRDLSAGLEVRSCFLTGLLETYQVIDKRDGSVIHEWDPK